MSVGVSVKIFAGSLYDSLCDSVVPFGQQLVNVHLKGNEPSEGRRSRKPGKADESDTVASKFPSPKFEAAS